MARQEVHEVDPADEQQKENATLQKEEDGLDLANMILVQRKDIRPESRTLEQVGVGVVFDLLRIEGVDLCLGDGDAGVGREAGDARHVVGVTTVRLAVVRVGGERDEELRLTRQVTEARRQYAHDGDR